MRQKFPESSWKLNDVEVDAKKLTGTAITEYKTAKLSWDLIETGLEKGNKR